MTSETFLSYLLQGLFFPPGINLFAAMLSWILWKHYRKLSLLLIYCSIISLLLLSTPAVSTRLLGSLESFPALTEQTLQQLLLSSTSSENNQVAPQAIVILSGGRRLKAPEFGNIDTVNNMTLERLRYGAYLHGKTQLPILVSGGSTFGEATSEAVLMNQLLSEELNTPATWLESKSKNTRENANYSSGILKNNHISHVLLVTHSWHMERSIRQFEQQGIEVTAAPTGFLSHQSSDKSLFYYLPSAKALFQSRMALHEYIGKAWYRFRD